MTDPQVSPISQLLYTLGITREDLEQRSDQMRQFLTAQAADIQPLRVSDCDTPSVSSAGVEHRPVSKTACSTVSLTRSRSRASSYSRRDATPPVTPTKSEATEGGPPTRYFDSMEMVIERQRRQNRRERRERREREREVKGRMDVQQPPSPSPSNASYYGANLDSSMHPRDSHLVLLGGAGIATGDTPIQVRERV